jgi:hypothetical protein
LIVALLFYLQVDEPSEEIEQAVPLQYLFPKVRSAIGPTGGIERIPSTAVATLIERQEVRRRTGNAGGHQYQFSIYREVDKRAPLELEDRFTRVAVLLVLPARIIDRLAREWVLQLYRDHRYTVQAQRDIERLLGARREAKLTGQPQAVCGIAGLEFRI